jgi:hypothetical protein
MVVARGFRSGWEWQLRPQPHEIDGVPFGVVSMKKLQIYGFILIIALPLSQPRKNSRFIPRLGPQMSHPRTYF